MSRAKPITLTPSMGGRLMSGTSAEAAGAVNWTIKRDFRRHLDQEIRAEGYDAFAPDPHNPLQPPTSEPITLIAMAQRPNGQRAVVVGTQTTIWRYYGAENGSYTIRDYVLPDYFEDTPGFWVQIGSGFSAQGRRWEAESINGYLCLNNGVDLPMTYRVEDSQVVPMYELRENGVASVGTIAKHGSRLLCADIRQIKDNLLDGILKGNAPYGTITDATKYDRFQWRVFPSMNDYPHRYGSIIGVTITPGTNTIVMDYAAKSVASGQSFLLIGAGALGSNLEVDVVWVNGKNVVVADGAITNSTITEELKTTMQAADALGGIAGKYDDLEGSSSAILKMLELDRYIVVYTESGIFVGSYTGDTNTPYYYEEMEIPEGRALRYRNTLVCVLGSYHLYAGDGAFYRFDLVNRIPVEMPEFQVCSDVFFRAVELDGVSAPLPYEVWESFLPGAYKTRAMWWRNLDFAKRYQYSHDEGFYYTITTDDAGHTVTKGYREGPVTMEVTEMTEVLVAIEPTGDAAAIAAAYPDGPTYTHGAVLREIIPASLETVFAAENPITEEIFFCFPYALSTDKALRFDFRHNTVSTTSAAYTAMAAVYKPESGIGLGVSEKWVAMGTAGKVLRYGKVNAKPIPSLAVTASKSGTTVTASSSFFSARNVGRSIVFADGQWFAIVEYLSPTQVRVLGSGNVSSQTFVIEPTIYHRDGSGYDSVLQSGLDGWGRPDSHKQWIAYVPVLGDKSSNAPLQVAFRSANNPSTVEDELVGTIDDPLHENLLDVIAGGHYLGDRITVSGLNNPVGIASRIFTIVGADSRSFSRRQN